MEVTPSPVGAAYDCLSPLPPLGEGVAYHRSAGSGDGGNQSHTGGNSMRRALMMDGKMCEETISGTQACAQGRRNPTTTA